VTTACRAALDHERSDTTGDDDAFTHEVVSAFGEAFNNIALHGYRGVAPGAIEVEVEWDADKLVVVVMDTGHTFDPDSVAPPDLDEMQESGMGVFIMRSCMDEVDYSPGPPNVLRLVKLRRPEAERPASSSRGATGVLVGLPSPASERAGSRREMDAALEESAWRMKAIPGQRWGLGPDAELEAEGARSGMDERMDERTAEGSRRR
jgi:serine/threonine-protein kinase RsbW